MAAATNEADSIMKWIFFVVNCLEYLWSHTKSLFPADKKKSIELSWHPSLVVKAWGAKTHWKRSPGLGQKAEYMFG